VIGITLANWIVCDGDCAWALSASCVLRIEVQRNWSRVDWNCDCIVSCLTSFISSSVGLALRDCDRGEALG
jgi:hypothetical protein